MAPIDRPLTDAERSYLHLLTIRVVAEQTRATPDAAVEALERITAEGKVRIHGDAENAYVEVNGQNLVHVERDWLAFHAHHDDGRDPMDDARPSGD